MKKGPKMEERGDTLLYRLIEDHYRRMDAKHGVYTVTAVGECIPSSLRLLKPALTRLVSDGVLCPHAPFLDAGCGDGRVVALAAFFFGWNAVGIEYDESICKRAQTSLHRLQKIIGDRRGRGRVVRGDFLESNPYDRVGIAFRYFGTVFNYANNHEKIAKKVATESPQGTLFLLYYPVAIPERIPGLRWMQAIPLSGCGSGPFLHVYESRGGCSK